MNSTITKKNTFPKLTNNLLLAFVVLTAIFFAIRSASATTVSIGVGSASPGESIRIPIELAASPGAAPAGLQMDIFFDGSLAAVEDVTAGPSAKAARKDVHFSSLSESSIRILIAGLNRNVMKDGVVAQISFRVVDAPQAEAADLVCGNLIASSPEADVIPTRSEDGRLIVTSVSQLSLTKLKISQNKHAPGQKAKAFGYFHFRSDKDLTQGIEIKIGQYTSRLSPTDLIDKGGSWQYKRPKNLPKEGIKKLTVKWDKKGDVNRNAVRFSLIIDDAQIFPGGIPAGSPISLQVSLRNGANHTEKTLLMRQKKPGKLGFPK